MMIWLIGWPQAGGDDVWDSAAVAAQTESEARHIHPSEFAQDGWDEEQQGWLGRYSNPKRPEIDGKTYLSETPGYSWGHPDKITARALGDALPETKAGVICASFNAG